MTEQLGDCYRVAARMTLESIDWPDFASDVRLVHAIVSGTHQLTGVRFGHAWVEFTHSRLGELVADFSNGSDRLYPRDLFYFVAEPGSLVKYDAEQTAKMMLQHEHYGPWDAAFADCL